MALFSRPRRAQQDRGNHHPYEQSGWFEVGQARIDAFADATDDHQWIHNDPERCRRESPYGHPVAHGFLTLALLPAMLVDAVTIEGMRIGVNYGLDRVRFPAPLAAGSRVRARWTLRRAEPVAGGWQLSWEATVEAEAQAKPVCVAEFLFRCYL